MSKDSNEDGKTFDMYHFFSRKDVIVACIAVVVFLLILLALSMFGTDGVT
jgi:hypothetical protein